MLENANELLTSVPDGAWLALVSAGAISLIMQGLKKWISLQSDKVITFLLTALSFIAASFDFVVRTVDANPMFLGQKTAVILGLTLPVYRYVIKPFTTLLTDAKAYRVTKEQQKVADADVASVTVPADSNITVTPTPTSNVTVTVAEPQEFTA